MSQANLIAPEQIQTRAPASTDERGTPKWLFELIQARYAIDGKFNLDACASGWNHKVDNYITEDVDALTIRWHATSVWLNPPYSCIYPWIEHALGEVLAGHCERVVMLLPVRASTNWWQAFRKEMATDIYLPERIDFDYPPGTESPNSPYESSCLWIAENQIRKPAVIR